MNKSDLYKLPKDILVELISKIQENTLNNKHLLIKYLNENHGTRIVATKCDYESCDVLEYDCDEEAKVFRYYDNYYCWKHQKKMAESPCDELKVFEYAPGIYRELKHGFLLKKLDSGELSVSHIIGDDGIERKLNDEEVDIALDLGLRLPRINQDNKLSTIPTIPF